MKNITIIIILLALIVVSLMFFDHTHFGGIDEEEDKNLTDALINRLYFTSTTISSVGYGDIVPKSRSLKLFTIIIHILVVMTTIDIALNISKPTGFYDIW